jgi:hypothetical protein
MRYNLKDTLIKAYAPMDIIWHVIVFQDEVSDFNEPWIIPYVIPMNRADCKSKMPQYTMRNWWIQNNEIIDNDYYVTVDDDDMYESGVFDAIKKMDDDIVIISMKRGDHIPDDAIPIRRYPIDTLLAHPDNIKRGMISSQQSFVKGKIFKKYLFDDTSQFGDGDMAIHHKQDGEQTAYRPDLFALFNFYEPGRWTKDNKISFGVIANDPYRLNTVFLKSSLPGKAHYLFHPESATKGLNVLLDEIEKEGAEIAVLAHQDMYFRNGWLEKVKEQLSKLPDSWIVAGIIGKDMEGRMCGKLHDMRIVDNINTCEVHTFPQPAVCFDECVIIVNMKKGFRFDESLDGFDLYGTLCVLQTWEMGGTAWIIDAWAEHYCMRPFSWWPDDTFKARYKMLYDRYIEKFETIDSTVFVSKPRFETSAA